MPFSDKNKSNKNISRWRHNLGHLSCGSGSVSVASAASDDLVQCHKTFFSFSYSSPGANVIKNLTAVSYEFS
jgi:hypothetical protein